MCREAEGLPDGNHKYTRDERMPDSKDQTDYSPRAGSGHLRFNELSHTYSFMWSVAVFTLQQELNSYIRDPMAYQTIWLFTEKLC